MKISGKYFKKSLQMAEITQEKAAELIGVSRQTVNTWVKSGELSTATIERIKTTLQIDLTSILEKELSQNGNITQRENIKPLINNVSDFSDYERPNHDLGYTENSTLARKLNTNNDEAPYLENVNVSAGLNFLTDNGSPTTYIKIPGAGVDAYINVFGDSMYPKYCAGEIIGVKQVQKEDLFFGHAFVIQMSDGEAYIKYIQPGKDDDHWSLESENPKYPPRQFHLSKISKIFKIKTTVTKNSL